MRSSQVPSYTHAGFGPHVGGLYQIILKVTLPSHKNSTPQGPTSHLEVGTSQNTGC